MNRTCKCNFYSYILFEYRKNKKLLKITRNNKKKHNKVVILNRSKLNSIETLISQPLIDLEIKYEEYKTMKNGEGLHKIKRKY